MLHAFVLIQARPDRVGPLCQELAAIEGVTEVFSVTGGVADIVAIVRVRHHDDLAGVVTSKMAAKDGIQKTTTLVAFEAYSRHDLEAIWDLGSA